MMESPFLLLLEMNRIINIVPSSKFRPYNLSALSGRRNLSSCETIIAWQTYYIMPQSGRAGFAVILHKGPSCVGLIFWHYPILTSIPWSLVQPDEAGHVCPPRGSSFLPSLPSRPLLFSSDETSSRQPSLTAQDQVKCPTCFHSTLCLPFCAHIIPNSNFLFLVCLP